MEIRLIDFMLGFGCGVGLGVVGTFLAGRIRFWLGRSEAGRLAAENRELKRRLAAKDRHIAKMLAETERLAEKLGAAAFQLKKEVGPLESESREVTLLEEELK